MTDLDRANKAQAELDPKYNETHRMAELLPVLRRNGVAEYNNDIHGVRIKFYERPALEMAQQVIGEEMQRLLTPPPITHRVADTELGVPAPIAPPFSVPPQPGAVEPFKYDLEDVLHGAK